MSFFKSLMHTLTGHETVSSKFDSIVDSGKKKKSLAAIKPPDPKKGTTTAIGDSFEQNGAIKVDNFFNNLSSYFRGDIYNFKQSAAINRCRQIAMFPEVDDALDEYVGEMYVQDIANNPNVVAVDYIEPKLFEEDLKEVIEKEFDYILNLLDFRKDGAGHLKQFLVDGVIYYEKVFDENYIQRGIIDLNKLDSAAAAFVQEYITDPQTQIRTLQDEYFIFSYNETSSVQPDVNPFVTVHSSAFRADFVIPKILVAKADSGVYHPEYGYSLSFIHRALKVANQLRLLEDAILVYRITRAPERRVFYVDVGNLPVPQAEEFMQELMKQYKTQKTYDVDTATVNSNAAVLNITEDFWLPRRNGVAGTQIETLAGAQNLGEINDLDYFNKKLWRALGVPFARRLSSDQGGTPHNTGAEITVDELKFKKKCVFRRERFNLVFEDLLRTQLVIKRYVNADDIDRVMSNIVYKWNEDNFFYEMLNLQITERKLDVAAKVSQEIREYVSKPWVSREIFGHTDEEIRELAYERDNPEKFGYSKDEEAAEGAAPGGGSAFGAPAQTMGLSAGAPTEEFGEEPATAGLEGETAEAEAPAEGEAAPEVTDANEAIPEF